MAIRRMTKANLFIIILSVLVLFYSVPALAAPADPGHGAPSIGPGTFETGFYVFPNNLSVTQNFSVASNTLFVDSVLSRVGIGTASPNESLEVSGNILMSPGTYLKEPRQAGNSPMNLIGTNVVESST